jgi:hypothetical protein
MRRCRRERLQLASPGTGGYADLLEALANPAHQEHEQYRQWAGEDFSPVAFDLAATNAALQRPLISSPTGPADCP